MVLVDTSVWIRFLADREPFASQLDRLLERDDVLGHALVYGELLIGERGGRARLLTDYRAMSQAAVLPHEEVVTFVRSRRIAGRGIGWIDAHLLASALVDGNRLWTADATLAKLATEIGVG
ncbi:MAG: type II toxin-antitoxin system VapC family toxin [Polyangia bacterium]